MASHPVNPTRSEILALMNHGEKFSNPYTTMALEDGFNAFVQESEVPRMADRRAARDYLRQLVGDTVTALNYGHLKTLVGAVLQRFADETVIDYTRYSVKGGVGEAVSSAEVSSALLLLQKDMSVTSESRDELQFYVTVLKNAEDYARSLSKTISALVGDEFFLEGQFAKLAERTRFAEPMVVDLDTTADGFSSLRADVVRIVDETLKSRSAQLLRTEASIRLQVTADSAERGNNRIQSRHDTSAPGERDGQELTPRPRDSDFEVDHR
jgi:hypothetical protein